MRVPGLGPKRIAQLYQERNINSMEALQNPSPVGELKGLAGLAQDDSEYPKRPDAPERNHTQMPLY
jgi:DNA polymerase/3'-5' exonuclease PolX